MQKLMEYYTLEYEGEQIPPAQRQRFLRRAYGWLQVLTVQCPLLRAEHENALRYAVCAAAEAIYNLEQKQVLKESNGDLSVTYASKLSATERQAVTLAVLPYLCGTGLLYCGVRAW